MRFLYFIVMCILITPVFSQSKYYSTLNYIYLNNNARSSGFADINTVSSDMYYSSGLNYNPALLNKNSKTLGAESFFPIVTTKFHKYNFGLYYAKFNKTTIAYFADYFEYKDDYSITKDPLEVLLRYKYQLFYHTVRFSRSLSKNRYWGIGIKHVVNTNLLGANLNKEDLLLRVNTVVVDLGYYKKHQHDFNKYVNMKNYYGAALLNIGPKIDSIFTINGEKVSPPSVIQLGVLSNFNVIGAHNVTLSVDFAYQVEKYLIPSMPSFTYSNNYIEIDKGYIPNEKYFKGVIQSFYDSPDGLTGEMNELIHKAGFEIRINNNQKFFGAIRIGKVIGYNLNNLNNYTTVGLRFGAYGFYIDYSRIPERDIMYSRLNFGMSLNLHGKKFLFEENSSQD